MGKQIGIIYGSTTGNTERAAELIAERLGSRAVLHNIADQGLDGIADYCVCIFGIPTWDYGELQEDWEEFWEELKCQNLKGTPCALFGLGDQIGYGEWFLDAMGLLHDVLRDGGAKIYGQWPVDGYVFEASKALTDDGCFFVGLALDDDVQQGETQERVDRWLLQLQPLFEL
ncbi:flavodoxin [Neptunomonas antarctica]|uniref:Flavodoxin n=1 Tax=Neptunomonas antarctica TaxID=619304 RepID=A0A1N7P968_9GAMM|nr:flavodoxin [Neptunomonas antarctica]SIT07100.1 flavodoxin II [Neptunomonas antarctica]